MMPETCACAQYCRHHLHCCVQGRLEAYRVGDELMGPKRVWLANSDTPGAAPCLESVTPNVKAYTLHKECSVL